MDILALPDVFLRQVMKAVGIKDRLRLRLTCRAFEQLVAETNAGHFENAFVSSWMPNKFTMTIGDALFYGIEWTEEKMGKRLELRNRLFSGISIGEFDFNIDDDSKALEFIRDFIANFKIGILGFRVQTEKQFENSLKLMKDFPSSKYTMDLCFLPETERLLSQPTMEELSIFTTTEISSSTCIKLIEKHKNLDLGDMQITPVNFKRAVQNVSADSRPRRILLRTKRADIIKCLREYGMSESSKAGDFCDQASLILYLL